MIYEPLNKAIGLNDNRNEFRISKYLNNVKGKKRTSMDFKNLLDDKQRNRNKDIFY